MSTRSRPDRGARGQDQRLRHRLADGRRGAAPRRRDRRDRGGRPDPVPGRGAEAAARSSPRSTRRISRASGRPEGAAAHRRVRRSGGSTASSEITPMGDPIAKTFRVRMALPDDTPLRVGMSVEANIVSREKPDALLVPSDAVHDNAVFVIENGRVRRREGRDRHSRHAAERNPVGAERGRAGRLAGEQRTQGRRARPRRRSRRPP